MNACACTTIHKPRRIVLTGGPGAGKTAILELVRQHFCQHVVVLGESASILFGGGFPRVASFGGRCAGQRAIFHIQHELEALGALREAAVVLCDRGTIDGLAYWPGPEEDFWRDVRSSRQEELARYDLVVHLRTPTEGYNHQNPLRLETAAEALAIDERILKAWADHPERVVIENHREFLVKAAHTLDVLYEALPDCCRHQVGPITNLLGRANGSVEQHTGVSR